MKTLFRLIFALAVLPVLTFGQTAKSRSAIASDVTSLYPDNHAGAITPAILRQVTNTIVASDYNPIDDGVPLRAVAALRPVSARGLFLQASGRATIVTGGTGNTYRWGHRIPFDSGNFVLGYGNWYGNSYGETPNTNSIIVKVALEYPIGTIIPVSFRGARSVTIEAGNYVASDPCGLTVKTIHATVVDGSQTTTVWKSTLTGATTTTFAGSVIRFTSGALAGQEQYVKDTASFVPATGQITANIAFTQAPAGGDTFDVIPVVYERVYASVVNAGEFIPQGARLQKGYVPHFFEGNAAIADQADSGTTFATTGAGYGAVRFDGMTSASNYVSVAQVGDSIMAGSGAEGVSIISGFAECALKEKVPTTMVALPGELTKHFMTDTQGFSRFRRMSQVAGHTSAIVNYGCNDFNSGVSFATWKSNCLDITGALQSVGCKVFWCTLLPRTTSTDGWGTTTNQTVTAGESVRLQINAYLRSGQYVIDAGGSAVAGVIDIAPAVEVTGGLWKTSTLLDSGTVTSATTSTTTDTAKSWTTNAFAGKYIVITSGTNAGAWDYIKSNTATVISGSAYPSGVFPGVGATYAIVDASTPDGIHPTYGGRALLSAAVDTSVFK